MRLALVCFYCLCVFCLCSLFYRDDVLCWLLLARPFLYAFHAHLRFPVDLVWFRLSCDHGWIRSGSVNVRKQQQQHSGVINSKASNTSKSNRAANARQIRLWNFGISKCFRNTSLCFSWTGNRAPQYLLPTSRLLQDPSLAHRQAMSNSGKRRGS